MSFENEVKSRRLIIIVWFNSEIVFQILPTYYQTESELKMNSRNYFYLFFLLFLIFNFSCTLESTEELFQIENQFSRWYLLFPKQQHILSNFVWCILNALWLLSKHLLSLEIWYMQIGICLQIKQNFRKAVVCLFTIVRQYEYETNNWFWQMLDDL